MKHRLLHDFTREEIKLAFDQADTQQNGHLRVEELKNAIGYLNLHLPNRRIVESKKDIRSTALMDSASRSRERLREKPGHWFDRFPSLHQYYQSFASTGADYTPKV